MWRMTEGPSCTPFERLLKSILATDTEVQIKIPCSHHTGTSQPSSKNVAGLIKNINHSYYNKVASNCLQDGRPLVSLPRGCCVSQLHCPAGYYSSTLELVAPGTAAHSGFALDFISTMRTWDHRRNSTLMGFPSLSSEGESKWS